MNNFIEVIRNATGGAPSLAEITPGNLTRFATSDKQGDKNGWCKLFEDQEGGVFGCWRQGISETWQRDKNMPPGEQTAFRVRVKKAQEEAKRLEAEQRAECRKRSADLWEKGRDVKADHPYLMAKNIKPYGIRQLKENLLVPVRDSGGTFHGLQFIKPDGSKKFKTGTAVSGCYLSIGKPNSKVLIVEGYATGSTLHEVTGHAVAVAFNCGNLLPVASALHAKYPAFEIVIAADDDHATEGNPGLTKASEAAKAVNGFLAVPMFPNTRGPKDTDFNDLARIATQEAVRACIDGAVIPTEETQAKQEPLLNVTIQRLAALPPLEYERVRKAEAKALAVRPGTLDEVVKAARKGTDNTGLPFVEVEPWAEKVDPARLLTDIARTIRRFIVCTDEIANAAALWIAMTWFMDVVQVAPLAVITAPEKRCGKTLLLNLLGKLSARSITASSISSAALFRTIEKWGPTLLIDEADAFLKDNEELRGMLNSGHTRDSAYVIRTVGDSFTPTKFSTWAAKAFAGIGHLSDTLQDRAINLELRRKLPHEVVERIRYAEANLLGDLRSKLARFAEDYAEQVRLARPPLPHSLNDRAQDNWEPLLAIAMTAGGDWLQIGTTAALKLSGDEIASQTVGTELLSDIQEIFKEKKVGRIATAELIQALCSDDEKPWKTYSKGFPITPRQLANKMKAYGIHSKTIRIGDDTAKGYEKDQLTEVFSRYIPSPPSESVTASQPAPVQDLAAFPSVTREDDVTFSNWPKSAPALICDVVTDKMDTTSDNIIDDGDADFPQPPQGDLREGIL